MKKVAFLFPGQGSQVVGMGHDLFENYEVGKKVYEKADEVLGRSISKICFEGPEEELKQTINTRVKSDRTCEAYCTWQRRQGKIKSEAMYQLKKTAADDIHQPLVL